MKEFDETDPPESESERLEAKIGYLEALITSLELEFASLFQRVADLEAQKVYVNPDNMDSEWYG